MLINTFYLGDGVYAEFDGFGVWLRANDHRDEFATDKIYLEPEVLYQLNGFIERMKTMKGEKE